MSADGSVDILTNGQSGTSNPCAPDKQAPEARHTLAQPARAGSENAPMPGAVGAAIPITQSSESRNVSEDGNKACPAPETFVPEPERYELRGDALHHFDLQRRDFSN